MLLKSLDTLPIVDNIEEDIVLSILILGYPRVNYIEVISKA